MNDNQELIRRLRKHFVLSESEANDADVLRFADSTIGGASVRLNMTCEAFVQALKDAFPDRASRSALDVLAGHYGVKRRFFGLEPDWMLRRRAYAAIARRPTRKRIDWPVVLMCVVCVLLLAACFAVLFLIAMSEPIA